MELNKVIGGNLARVVGRGNGAEFASQVGMHLGDFAPNGWNKSQYYEATAGRRVFRVAELLAFALAARVQAYELLDATALGATKVELFPGTAAIPGEQLRDLFKIPDLSVEAPVFHAYNTMREVIPDIGSALDRLRKLHKELRHLYREGRPGGFPVLEGEEE